MRKHFIEHPEIANEIDAKLRELLLPKNLPAPEEIEGEPEKEEA